ncbi:MAG: enoyl-CoA hydratase/isomerase family protein [SAR202 cluster bacterium]|nr:enoyl-CoA hydratase/isomerase family protein [SAR202 cluster bacterium]
MPDYKYVILEKDSVEHIARLTINRPGRRNALNDETTTEMGLALDDVAEDDDIRVLIITGAGGSFCAGGDLNTLKGDDPGVLVSENSDDIRRGFRGPHKMILGVQRMEKPVIAMISGNAVGAGFDLAAACDIRIATLDARFMVAYVKIGLFPGFGGTWLYPRTLGSLGKAAELLFTGDFLEADEAYRLGFLNRLVAAEDLEATTMEMARKIAAGPPIAIRLSKLMLYKGLEFDLETALKMAAAAETITLTSQDHDEGTQAIRESRKPIYEGR